MFRLTNTVVLKGEMKHRWRKPLNVATVVALLFALASPTSVMGSPARIEEPSFETVAYWMYSETDNDYVGAQSADWAPPPQGSFSYKLSCLSAGIGPNKYTRIAQSVNFNLLDTIYFDTRLYATVTNFEAQVWVGTTKVWSKAVPVTTTEYLQEKVDVSGYTGSLDLIFQIENIGGQVTATMESYFDNIKIWGSYSDAAWQTVANNFSGGTDHVYMYGENFDSGTTKVGYYDGANNLKETDTYSSFGGGDLYESECILNQDWGETLPAAGTWHAVVLLQADDLPNTYAGAIADPDYITDDDFYVASSAIPEFPTVITAIVVTGLCFGIYYWMRKRRLVYVKT